MIKMHF